MKTVTAETTTLSIAMNYMSGDGRQKRKTLIDWRGQGCTLTLITCTLIHIFDSDAAC